MLRGSFSSRPVFVVGASLFGWFCLCQSAFANAEPTNAQLFDLIKSLQARVVVLEQQSDTYRKQATEARAAWQDALQQIAAAGARPDSSILNTPMLLAGTSDGAAGSRAPLRDGETTLDPWSGIYWGTSFGGGLTRGQVAALQTYTSESPDDSFPERKTGQTTISRSGPDDDGGAALDVFLGVNRRLGSRFVTGLQAEGSLAELNFDSDGTHTQLDFDETGPDGRVAHGPFRPHVHARWMVSALARAGWLIDPTLLVYGLAGWTGAEFDYQNLSDNLFYRPGESFWANGVSMGGGLEKKT